MTPEFQAKLEKVLTAFGIWMADEKCDGADNDGYCAIHNHNGRTGPHDIPLPDLTPELAWRCVEEVVWKRGYALIFENGCIGLSKDGYYKTTIAVVDGHLAEALIASIIVALEK